MNLLVPHTVLVISAARVHLDWLRPGRILGPGIYHFEGDLRPRLRTLSQRKLVDRGFVEVRFQSGDTVVVLKELLEIALTAKDEKRLAFVYGLAGLAGVNLTAPVVPALVANLESNEDVGKTPPLEPDDAADAKAFSGIPGIPEVAVTVAPEVAAKLDEAQSPAGDNETVVVTGADEPGDHVIDLKAAQAAQVVQGVLTSNKKKSHR